MLICSHLTPQNANGSTRKLNNIPLVEIQVVETALERTETFKYVGFVLNENFTWHDHIDSLLLLRKLTKGLE